MNRVKRQLRHYRRRWCIWRGHPTYGEIVLWTRTPDILNADGSITDGVDHVVKALRCAVHEPRRGYGDVMTEHNADSDAGVYRG